jgi:hypothetical protein
MFIDSAPLFKHDMFLSTLIGLLWSVHQAEILLYHFHVIYVFNSEEQTLFDETTTFL